MKKAIFIATVGGFFGFERNDIKILQSLGYEVHIAANLSLSERDDFQAEGIIRHQIDFARAPWSITNLNAYKQLKKLFSEIHFDLVHCHTPMGGVIGRLAAKKYRKSGTKVIYTAHGFHFFKGAPLKNWLLYYPVEWLCAFWTDELITINKEDYARAQKHMHAKHVTYIPGVGVDLKKFSPDIYAAEDLKAARAELGLADGDKMLLSVGELNKNKNHEVVIRALAEINDATVHYAIAGTGELHDHLENLAKELGVSERVHLLGYRTDVAELYKAADLYIHPSLREGLPVAVMEAIASKTPVICSNIRGNVDLVAPEYLFSCYDVDQAVSLIKKTLSEPRDKKNHAENQEAIQQYDCKEVIKLMKQIYELKK